MPGKFLICRLSLWSEKFVTGLNDAIPLGLKTVPWFSQRLASFVEDAEIAVIDEDAVATLAGELAGDASRDEALHGLARGRKGQTVVVAHTFERQHRAMAQGGEHAQSIGGGASGLLDAAGIRFKQIHQTSGGLDGTSGSLIHAFEKKVHPRLPVAGGADAVEQFVIQRAMLFEIQREIKERLGKQTAMVQQQNDKQAAEPSVAIEKGMDGFRNLNKTICY